MDSLIAEVFDQRYALLSECSTASAWEQTRQILQLTDRPDTLDVIPVSGGVDSTLLALLLHWLYPEIPFRKVFSDTGAEDPEIYAVWNQSQRTRTG